MPAKRLPLATANLRDELREGTVIYAKNGIVHVTNGTSTLRNVPIATPLNVDDIAVKDRVLIAWTRDRPYIYAVLKPYNETATAAAAAATAASSNPTSGPSIVPEEPTPPSGQVVDELYVGRYEGPHAGLFVYGSATRKEIALQVSDTGNVPFLSAGAIDFESNSKWLHIGYSDKAHIRLDDSVRDSTFPEDHPDVIVELECLDTEGAVDGQTIVYNAATGYYEGGQSAYTRAFIMMMGV